MKTNGGYAKARPPALRQGAASAAVSVSIVVAVAVVDVMVSGGGRAGGRSTPRTD